MLEVRLGYQIIAEAFGGKTVRADHPVYGTATPVWHGGCKEFADDPNRFLVGRYHSLVVDRQSLSDEAEISA